MNIKTKEPKAKTRPKRVALNSKSYLEAESRPGYRRRWVLEVVGRVDDYVAAYWEFVRGSSADISHDRAQKEGQIGSVVRRVVNRDPNSSATHCVLMEVEEKYYNEDQVRKAEEISQKEKSLIPVNDKKSYGDLDITSR